MKIRKNPARVSGGLVTAIALTLASANSVQAAGAALVFQTDFSLKDGVGTDRRGVVMRAKTGQLFVTPDNGTLTFVSESLGVAELREIDTARQRLKGSEASYTFHGRDVFAYVGARLAVGKLEFADVGPRVTNGVVSIPYTKAAMKDGALVGTIPVLDVQYGNVWSNIGQPLLDGLGARSATASPFVS